MENIGSRKGVIIIIDNEALIKDNGVIYDEYECIVCKGLINWYTPVEKTYIEKAGLVKAEIIVDQGCTLNTSPSDQELVTNGYITVECPHCSIKNKFTGVKWKVK